MESKFFIRHNSLFKGLEEHREEQKHLLIEELEYLIHSVDAGSENITLEELQEFTTVVKVFGYGLKASHERLEDSAVAPSPRSKRIEDNFVASSGVDADSVKSQKLSEFLQQSPLRELELDLNRDS